MITDYEQELTLAGGHDLAFAAGSEYGSKPYDLKVPTAGVLDPAVGEPLDLFLETVVNGATFTTLQVELVADDDGAGTNEVSLGTKTFAVANLTTAKGVQRVARIDPGAAIAATNKYLTAKLTIVGTTGTGKVRVFFMKGRNMQPANVGRRI